MEHEGSLRHSQVPTTCPYPEPPPSSPYIQNPLPEDPSCFTHTHKHYKLITFSVAKFHPICTLLSEMKSREREEHSHPNINLLFHIVH